MVKTFDFYEVNWMRVALFSIVLMFVCMIAGDAFAQSGGVQFGKIDNLGNSFINWLRNNPTRIFFTLALIVLGFLAAFNRISWMWVVMLCVGAFFAFGAPAIVQQLKTIFT